MTTLKDLRIAAGKTQKEVADALGVTGNAICNYESGIRRIGIDLIIPLAELYGVSEREIIEAQLESQNG